MICGMKQRILLAAVLLWTVVNGFAQIGQAGQKVVTGSQWNIGWGQFEAYATPAKIQMTSVHEGETLAFELIPKGKAQYFYAAAPESVGEDPQIVPKGAKVVVKNQEGLKVVIFYDAKDRIENAMFWTFDSPLHNSRWFVIPECCGKYAIGPAPKAGEPDNRERVTIGQLDVTFRGVRVDYEVESLNDQALNIITIAPGSDLSGTWYATPTASGLNLYECQKDEYGQFTKVGRTMTLYHADPEQGRWHFASMAMLNRYTLGHYRKSSLRLMRNEILASHGYKFTTKDLVTYFTSQPWYHPAESNDHVQLSFYEQMTVALIQAEERKPDSERSPIEEDPLW